jgi:hypothetical protein
MTNEINKVKLIIIRFLYYFNLTADFKDCQWGVAQR